MTRTRSILVAVAAAVLLGGGVHPAGAGSAPQQEQAPRLLDWTRASDPVVLRPSTVVHDIACPSAGTTCVAVGERRDESGAREAVVRRWDGAAWTAEAPPGGKSLVKVSCSTVDDCAALEQPQWEGGLARRVAVRSDAGWRWVGFEVPDGAVEVTSVSCASPTWCLLTGGNREVAVLDGGVVRWLPRTPVGVIAVSCSSTASCAAAAGGAFLDWDGTRWAATALDATGVVNDVDCWADQRCVATVGHDDGSSATFVRSPEGGWASSGTLEGSSVSSDYGQPGVDCDSQGRCHVLRQIGRPRSPDLALASWTAGTWVSHTLPRTEGQVVGLGCRPGECVVVAVGLSAFGEPTRSSALHGYGDQWAQRAMVNPLGRAPGVSPHEATCASRSWCLVLGTTAEPGPSFGNPPVEQYVVRGDGEDWDELPAALEDQRDLDCWRPGECVVVGSDGRRPRSALLRDGRWRVMPALSAPWMAGGVLTGVGCAGARCSYSGFYRARKDAGIGVFVARRTGGTWRAERFGPLVRNEQRFTGRPSMDCPTASRCVVVTSMRLTGDKQPTSFEAALVGDRWRWTRLGTGFSLFEVDCADVRRCVAGGQRGSRGLAMAKDGGAWRRVDVRTRNAAFNSVSCPTTDTCHVAGQGSRLQLLTRTGAGWRARPSGPRHLTDVACSGPRACLAFNTGRAWVGR